MKTYKHIYSKIYNNDNLHSAFMKARKGKSKKIYVKNFENNLGKNLNQLQSDLVNRTYHPSRLKKFTIRDPKTRTIHSSIFRDRIIHHAIINILSPIYEKIFIYDSFASRKNKGNHKAILRLEKFIKKVSSNGKLIKNPYNNNQIKGYYLKADFKKYFDSVNQEVLINILKNKFKDKDFIQLISKILRNFGKDNIGMPLKNYTSQFFANIYLNELDYFIKHNLKAKYYIRYVDDFIILHKNKKRLEYFLKEINNFLPNLKVELHKDKTSIRPLSNGVEFLGYRIFYYNRLLRKRNIRHFKRKLKENKLLLENQEITNLQFESRIKGWLGYADFSNSYNLKKRLNLLT